MASQNKKVKETNMNYVYHCMNQREAISVSARRVLRQSISADACMLMVLIDTQCLDTYCSIRQCVTVFGNVKCYV